MIDKRVDSVEAALAGLQSGMRLMISGFGGAGFPAALVKALAAGEVRDIRLVSNTLRIIQDHAPGLFAPGRIRDVICSSARSRGSATSDFEALLLAGKLPIELVPQGTFAERLRAGGAGIPAFYTPTGVGTRLTEGKEEREFDGRAYVLEHAITADFALLRGHRADRWGNVVFKGTQANFGPAMAAASRIAVVEVDSVQDEPLDPHGIHLPGIHVQRVVEAADAR
jgi:3-oxoacid CoA-transferase A subunit